MKWDLKMVPYFLMVPMLTGAASFHYTPERISCSANAGSVDFFQYGNNTVARKRLNGSISFGQPGDDASVSYDDVVFTELSNNALDIRGKPIDEGPTFEMHLDRPRNSYVGAIDFMNSDGTKSHWNFKSCTEFEFVESKIR